MEIKKTRLILKPNPKRVLLRSFEPGSERRRTNILKRILSLNEEETISELNNIEKEFGTRHRDLSELFTRIFNRVAGQVDNAAKLSKARQMLIGASLSMEYSIESAALFNPSIVWHPDQSSLLPGNKRFIISLRATGEGHISSIVFRTGILDTENNINIEETSGYVTTSTPMNNTLYDKSSLQKQIYESGLGSNFTEHILSELSESYSYNELKLIINNTLDQSRFTDQNYKQPAEEILSLCFSEYNVSFDASIPISERVIFPISPAESNGIEDARFVKFQTEDGMEQYYATYTAYNGFRIQSQLLETRDFLHFKINKLFGTEIKNKGMALFPRKIKGKYAMLSRQDGENNFIMFSDNLYLWNDKILLSSPAFSWEVVQSGNCGSPIETDQGWLVLTHGVGPVRKYCIGAILLDLEDPTKVIGRLKEPLISPDENEREGYVPNVVYSCGSLINNDELIIPYAISDSASTFAKVNLNDLLNELNSR